MVTPSTQLVSIPGLSDPSEIWYTSSGLPFSVSLGLLRLLLRSKLISDLGSQYRSLFYHYLSQCGHFASDSQKMQALSTFQGLVNNLDQNPDYAQSVLWLLSYLNQPSVVDAVSETGKLFLTVAVSSKGLDFDQLMSTEPGKSFDILSEMLGIHIKVCWEGGNYLYQHSSNTKAFILYYYYFQECFFYVHTAAEKIVENGQQADLFSEPFVFGPETVGIDAISETKILPQEEADNKTLAVMPVMGQEYEICDPALKNLISEMANAIANKKLYSKDIHSALYYAYEKVDKLDSIPGLKRLLEIQAPYCQVHLSNVEIESTCGNKHCEECVFEKIFNEFNAINTKIYCECGKQIAPKLIDRLKKEHKYQEFKEKTLAKKQ
jgi:hypothetical protein